MANNLTEVIPKLLAQGLLALRENSVMPRLVNIDYANTAAEKGDTINVPIPSAVAVTDVTPSADNPNPADTEPGNAPIPLNRWKEAAFYLTDKDLMEAVDGIIPMQASEAIKALANTIDGDILALYKDIYGYAGTPGTTPFASNTSDATAARKVLNNQLAPLQDRRFVIDPDAEANALDLRAFQDMSFSGSAAAILEGQINRKLGFDWHMDQNCPLHTVGTNSGTYTTSTAGFAVGVKDVAIITGTGTILEGDILTFAGQAQTYVCTTDRDGAGTLSFEPALKVALPASAVAITVKGTASTPYAQNMAFHRDAFAFASRPLADTSEGLGNIIQSAVDPISGLTLRLEVTREYKRTRYSYDILYGCATIRRALATRVWGA